MSTNLREAGMWVLLSSRDMSIVEPHEAVVLDELTEAEAEGVLRGAASLPAHERLFGDAIEVLKICGFVAMDVAFVGSWSSVRTGSDGPARCETTTGFLANFPAVQKVFLGEARVGIMHLVQAGGALPENSPPLQGRHRGHGGLHEVIGLGLTVVQEHRRIRPPKRVPVRKHRERQVQLLGERVLCSEVPEAGPQNGEPVDR